ncbi:transposase [Cellulosilyticum ruminicola]|uniref:transposase n=1 Tax=Cellulosilyticum ruminicola TaxID=425254 RepID=UPI0012EE04B6
MKVVSRDGAITYKKAITLAHPQAIQMSDRFHILKNLTSYCKDTLLKLFKAKVKINLAESEPIFSLNTTFISVNL